MVLSGVGLAALFLSSSVAAATLALGAGAYFGPRSARARRAAHRPGAGEGIIFLFDDETLVDATRAGDRLIAAAPAEGTDWSRLLSLLGPEFPDLAQRVENLPAESVQVFRSRDSSTELTAEWRDGLRRLALVDEDVTPPSAEIDSHNLSAMERELDILRANTDQSPVLVWRQNAAGEVTWFNRRYLEELRRLRGPGAADRWPVAPLFDPRDIAEAAKAKAPVRAALDIGGSEACFEIHVRESADEHVCSALSIDRLVGAERQLRSFMQTLTKTFADLDTGLAIFDRSRRLVMFNPALADLTGLPPGFLTAHPTLYGFLDRMRDLGRVPEPRNYAEWRKRLADLESDAAGGSFHETWTLPGGETIRVTGRPHPDGAVAFIFEDISDEVTLTRRFRSELAIGQSVLDTLDEAVAVFSSSGTMTMANSAYAGLWGDDPMARIDRATVNDVLPLWVERTAPSAVWSEAASFLAGSSGRTAFTSEAMLLDGRSLICRFVPLAGGATLVGFEAAASLARGLRFQRRA